MNQTMASGRKIEIVTVVLFVIVLGCIFLFGNIFSSEDSRVSVKTAELMEAPKKDAGASIDTTIAVNKIVATTSTPSSEKWNPMGDSASRKEILDWFASRGNFSFDDPSAPSDYKQYDTAVLEQMGEQGDLRALNELVNRAETLEQRKPILVKAAMFGSTAAITRLGTAIESEFQIDNLPSVERKAYILEAMAFYEAAEIRGDWWGKINDGASLLKRYDIDLNGEEKKLIATRAKELVENFEKMRVEKGLQKFDNSVPDSVIKFYEEMLRPL